MRRVVVVCGNILQVARAVWLSSAAVRAIVSNTDGPSPAPIWTSSPADSAPDLIDNIRSNIAEGTRFALATFLSRLDAGDALNPAAARPRSDL